MQDAERDAIFAVADLMAAAAKTAPKGSGRDTIVTAIVSEETKDQLRDKLTELGTKYEEAFMVRGCRKHRQQHLCLADRLY